MQVDLTTGKLKTLAKRLARDLSLTPEQRRATLDSLAKGFGHKNFPALEKALADPGRGAPASPAEPDETTLNSLLILQDQAPRAGETRQAQLDDFALRWLRQRGHALCIMGAGDVATAISMHEDRDGDVDDDDLVRARAWIDRHGRDLEEQMGSDGNAAIESLVAVMPPPPAEALLPANAWIVAITPVVVTRDGVPSDPEDADVAGYTYWTVAEGDDWAAAQERALDLFHTRIPVSCLEDFDFRTHRLRLYHELPADAVYCADTYTQETARKMLKYRNF